MLELISKLAFRRHPDCIPSHFYFPSHPISPFFCLNQSIYIPPTPPIFAYESSPTLPSYSVPSISIPQSILHSHPESPPLPHSIAAPNSPTRLDSIRSPPYRPSRLIILCSLVLLSPPLLSHLRPLIYSSLSPSSLLPSTEGDRCDKGRKCPFFFYPFRQLTSPRRRHSSTYVLLYCTVQSSKAQRCTVLYRPVLYSTVQVE